MEAKPAFRNERSAGMSYLVGIRAEDFRRLAIMYLKPPRAATAAAYHLTLSDSAKEDGKCKMKSTKKTIALYIKTGKLTAQTLQKAMKTLLAQMKKQKDKAPQGKQTLKQLMKQNAGVSSIEITEAISSL